MGGICNCMRDAGVRRKVHAFVDESAAWMNLRGRRFAGGNQGPRRTVEMELTEQYFEDGSIQPWRWARRSGTGSGLHATGTGSGLHAAIAIPLFYTTDNIEFI